MGRKSPKRAKRRQSRLPELVLTVALVAVSAGGAGAAWYSSQNGGDGAGIVSGGDIGVRIAENRGGSLVWTDMVPGEVFDEEFRILNTDDKESEYVGVRVSFQKAKDWDKDGAAGEWEPMTQQDVDDLFVGLSLTQSPSAIPRRPGFDPDVRWARGDGAAKDTLAPEMMFYLRVSLPPGPEGASSFIRKASISPEAGTRPWKAGAPVTLDNYLTWLHTEFPGGRFRVVFEGAAVEARAFFDAKAADPELLKLLSIS